jgi:hypothetical protein
MHSDSAVFATLPHVLIKRLPQLRPRSIEHGIKVIDGGHGLASER